MIAHKANKKIFNETMRAINMVPTTSKPGYKKDGFVIRRIKDEKNGEDEEEKKIGTPELPPITMKIKTNFQKHSEIRPHLVKSASKAQTVIQKTHIKK